jgi:hypothetical protein
MRAEIEKTLEMLKEKVERNNQIISHNSRLLKHVIEQPVSDLRTQLFTVHFKKNLELYSSNHLYIKLQFELHKAMNQREGLKTFGMMSLS